MRPPALLSRLATEDDGSQTGKQVHQLLKERTGMRNITLTPSTDLRLGPDVVRNHVPMNDIVPINPSLNPRPPRVLSSTVVVLA